MATITYSMQIQCDDASEYDEALARLSDEQTVASITEDAANNTLQVALKPMSGAI